MFKRNALLSLSALLLLAGVVMAKEWWEKKAFDEWSEKDVKQMLDNSPWGRIHTVTIMNPTVTGTRDFQSIGTGDLEREKLNRFHLRFLSSKPVRMAIARNLLLNSKGNLNKEALERFINQGDPQNIVITLTLSSNQGGSSALRGYWTSLQQLSLPLLAENTFLATNTGKRVYIAHYEPPGKDGLGAKFFFPRTMEDGTPFITSDDKEVRFETSIKLLESGTNSANPGEEDTTRNDRIWMKYDLRKMIFDGKLEI